MKLFNQFKNIKRKGLSEILFMAFAAIAIFITIVIAFG
jgi:hypothetical protein